MPNDWESSNYDCKPGYRKPSDSKADRVSSSFGFHHGVALGWWGFRRLR